MADVICGDCTNAKERGGILARRMVESGVSLLGNSAAFLCLRLARKLSLGELHLQASGNFDIVSHLFHYGVGLCETIPNQVVLAQVHATYGRVLVGINQHAKALVHFERVYTYAISKNDEFISQDDLKFVADKIIVCYSELGVDYGEGLKGFYRKIEETWPLRFTDEKVKATLENWKNQRPTWELKTKIRNYIRQNRFHKAQDSLDIVFAQKLPPDDLGMELFGRTNIAMNYGRIDFAKKATEELDMEPYNMFTRSLRSDNNYWHSFSTCVERTAFANSIRFREHLESSPSYLSFSPDPQDHRLEDFQKLVHIARTYIFQENWVTAFGLLRCSCILATRQRQKITDEDTKQSQIGSSDAEKAFDWTIWVCLHFNSTPNSPTPKELDKDATYDTWSKEALRYAEMGKALRIRDLLKKQRMSVVEAPKPKEVSSYTQYTEHLGGSDLLNDLLACLDPYTLVIHMTLIHEGFGLICLNNSGIQYAQWFPDFGIWDSQRLTSILFSMLASSNNPQAIEIHKKHKKLSDNIIELSKALISPIGALLEKLLSRSLYFIPAGYLSGVPFAALEHKGLHLLDKFSIYQVPSLRILEELSESYKAKPRGLTKMSVVAMSSHEIKDDLIANAVECIDAADQFGNKAHLESAMNIDKQGFIKIFEDSDVIHVGTHGDMVYEKPLSSYIDLKEQFSVADLRGVKSRATLVFLSACLTGLGLSTLTDDMTGFQAQILESGALAFAGSLWSVHAVASMFFVHFFYEGLSSPKNPNQSLSEIFTAAQRRLRDLNRVEADGIVDKMQECFDRLKETAGIPSDLLRNSEKFFKSYKSPANG